MGKTKDIFMEEQEKKLHPSFDFLFSDYQFGKFNLKELPHLKKDKDKDSKSEDSK